jgi:secreted trypsin-like serine protease
MKNAPGIYTRVSAMTQWIEDTMASSSPPADDVGFDEEETTTGYLTSTTIITTTVPTTTTMEKDALLTPGRLKKVNKITLIFRNDDGHSRG